MDKTTNQKNRANRANLATHHFCPQTHGRILQIVQENPQGTKCFTWRFRRVCRIFMRFRHLGDDVVKVVKVADSLVVLPSLKLTARI